jgi:VWFA-related protein
VQPFTSDGDELGDSLAEIFDDAGHAAVRRRDQIDALRRIDRARDARQALIYAQQYAEEQRNGVEYAAEALERMIESLGGLPGRKALVHVSSGIPMSAGEEMFHVVGEKFDDAEAYGMIPRYDTSRTFERVNQLANTHRVAFYTIDAGGMRGMEFGKAEYGGFVDPTIRKILDSVVHESLQAPLRLMALETGGQTIVNQNEILPALDKAARDFRSFYSLGIAAGSQTGRYHRVEVRLAQRRRGIELRHREGYRSKSTDTRARERLRSALLYTDETDTGGVRAEWGRAERGDDGNYVLPIRLSIPLRDIALLPTALGKHEARLRLYFGAVGPDGEASAIESIPLGLRFADEHVEAARSESILHTHRLVVDRGKRRIGVTVMDLASGGSWVVTRSVEVGGPSERE